MDHPQHYGGADNPYEAIKIIRARKLGFAPGNVVKYLRKARWYIDNEIAALESGDD